MAACRKFTISASTELVVRRIFPSQSCSKRKTRCVSEVHKVAVLPTSKSKKGENGKRNNASLYIDPSEFFSHIWCWKAETYTAPHPIHQTETILGCHCYLKNIYVRTKEPRCHSADERICLFSLFLREDTLFPLLIIFLSALQVAVLHVDGDAVEFNELWAEAEGLSCKINEWQSLAPGSWRLHPSRAHPDADAGWVPRAASPSRAAHGSLVNDIPGFPAIVLFILSISGWPVVEEETNHLCCWALEKVSPSQHQCPWASLGSSPANYPARTSFLMV